MAWLICNIKKIRLILPITKPHDAIGHHTISIILIISKNHLHVNIEALKGNPFIAFESLNISLSVSNTISFGLGFKWSGFRRIELWNVLGTFWAVVEGDPQRVRASVKHYCKDLGWTPHLDWWVVLELILYTSYVVIVLQLHLTERTHSALPCWIWTRTFSDGYSISNSKYCSYAIVFSINIKKMRTYLKCFISIIIIKMIGCIYKVIQ